jgi:acetoin utilization deacetylase AcuC-like enzyme
MSIAIISHPDCLLHGRDIDHPEQPARITAIEDQLKRSNLNNTLQHYQASMATREQLYRVHARRYVDLILDHLPSHQTIWLDPDTYCTADSGNAALRAAGANILGVDLVMNNRHDVAFCNIRPPGHHAVINHAMGFCLFINTAMELKPFFCTTITCCYALCFNIRFIPTVALKPHPITLSTFR